MHPHPLRHPHKNQIHLHLLIIVLALLNLPACNFKSNSAWAPDASPQTTNSSPAASWYSLYFTDPESPQANSYRGGPDSKLAAAIANARAGVDVAVYQLDLYSLRDALRAAHRRGVRVRVVTDSDNLDQPEVQALIEAGIPVLGDRHEGLMHDKFTIIDSYEVWTGSMNYTVNDAYRNNNNLIRIRSATVARDYQTEFEEMFLADQFGPGSPANTPHPVVSVDGTLVEVFFSPDDGVAKRLVDVIGSARKSIHILAYSFTSDPLAEAILERSRAGVKISGVFESSQVKSNLGGEFERFLAAGLDVRLDGNPRNLHDKVIIVDGNVVITGSYNFSRNAEQINDENVLILHSPEIAGQYLAQFQKLYLQAGQ